MGCPHMPSSTLTCHQQPPGARSSLQTAAVGKDENVHWFEEGVTMEKTQATESVCVYVHQFGVHSGGRMLQDECPNRQGQHASPHLSRCKCLGNAAKYFGASLMNLCVEHVPFAMTSRQKMTSFCYPIPQM
eukprot:931785-Pelagomonas_calceolata.AAC.5